MTFMTLMELFANLSPGVILGELLGPLLIGLLLGMTGSGGSIVTVPLLVYVVGHDPKQAIGESLAIVAGISIVSAFGYLKAGLVDWRKAGLVAIPGMLGAMAGVVIASWLMPWVQMLLLAIVMLLASVWMFKHARGGLSTKNVLSPERCQCFEHDPARFDQCVRQTQRIRQIKAVMIGFATGVLSGLIGVGGGFLVVPGLMLLGGLDFKRIIGTSLVIVMLNAVSGLLQLHITQHAIADSISWPMVFSFIFIGSIGGMAGQHLASKCPEVGLKRGFATLLIGLGIFVLMAG